MSFQVAKPRIKGETLPREYRVVERDYIGNKDSHKASLRVLKWASPYKSAFVEAYTGTTQNTEAVNMEGKRQKMHPDTNQKKVGTVAYSREILSETYRHDFFHERLKGYSGLGRTKVRNCATDCTVAEKSEQNDGDNDTCSVGSCSVNAETENKYSNCSRELPCLDRDFLFSDAESSYCTGHEENCCHSLEEKVGITVHSLELHAYRCTLGALYASGPLSWEQEELLTNLRIMLHVSNDEHLTELRNLIPPGTSK